jgi:hypothetical protein
MGQLENKLLAFQLASSYKFYVQKLANILIYQVFIKKKLYACIIHQV